VVDHEGSRSFKAIAFIGRKATVKAIYVLADTYSEPFMSPERKTAILVENRDFRIANETSVCLRKSEILVKCYGKK